MERVLVDVCLVHVFYDVDLTELIRLQVSTAVCSTVAGDEGVFSPHRYSASLDCKDKPRINLRVRSEGREGNEPDGYVGDIIISVNSSMPDVGVYSLQNAGQTDGP